MLADLVDHTERVLTDNGLPSEQASVLAHSLAHHFAEHWGGQLINFPMDYRWQLDKLWMAIYDRFKEGATYSQLAMAFKISDRHVRTVLATVEKRMREQARSGAPGQSDFFDAQAETPNQPAPASMARIYRALRLSIYDLSRKVGACTERDTLVVLINRATGQAEALHVDAKVSAVTSAVRALAA